MKPVRKGSLHVCKKGKENILRADESALKMPADGWKQLAFFFYKTRRVGIFIGAPLQ